MILLIAGKYIYAQVTERNRSVASHDRLAIESASYLRKTRNPSFAFAT